MKFNGELNLDIKIEIKDIGTEESVSRIFKFKKVRLKITQKEVLLYDDWFRVGETINFK